MNNRMIFKNSFLLAIFLLFSFFSFAFGGSISISPDIIFTAENIFPGEVISSNVLIKNNTDNDFNTIKIKAIRESAVDEFDISKIIDISVENQTTSLFNLFGESYLLIPNSKINKSEQKELEIKAIFRPDAGQKYQNKSISFSLVFVFESQNITTEVVVSGAGGGGSPTLPLTIYNENHISFLNEAIISWQTNRPVMSKIVYGTNLGVFDLNNESLSYGYPYFIKEEANNTVHQIIIENLLPETTYYYRIVASDILPTVSREYSFRTLGSQIDNADFFEEYNPIQYLESEISPPLESNEEEIFEESENKESEIDQDEEKAKEETELETEEENPETALGFLGATIGFFTDLDYCQLLFWLIIILILIFVSKKVYDNIKIKNRKTRIR